MSVAVGIMLLSNGTTFTDNDNDTSGDIYPQLDIPSSIVIGVILGSVTLMTIVGNVLVLLAVFVNSHLRGTTHYFIANLAVADLLLGTTVLPFSVSDEVLGRWSFGRVFCGVWAATDVLCCTASIMSLCVISIDRYIGVTRPLRHSTIVSERRAAAIIVIVWLLSVAVSVAPLFGWRDKPSRADQCAVTKKPGYVAFSVICSFYIPMAIIVVVYFRVYREALKQSRFLVTGIKTARSTDHSSAVTLRVHMGGCAKGTNTCQLPVTNNTEHHRKAPIKATMTGKIAKFKREKKAAKTLGIVVGVFLLCWLPFFFILPLESLCRSCKPPRLLFKIAFWLGYCNSMMNPIIYASSSREFNRAFVRILRCRLFRRRHRHPFCADFEAASSTSISHAANAVLTPDTSASRLDMAIGRLQKMTHLERRHRNTANTSAEWQVNCGQMCQALSLGPLPPLTPSRQQSTNVNSECGDAFTISDEDSVVHETSDCDEDGSAFHHEQFCNAPNDDTISPEEIPLTDSKTSSDLSLSSVPAMSTSRSSGNLHCEPSSHVQKSAASGKPFCPLNEDTTKFTLNEEDIAGNSWYPSNRAQNSSELGTVRL